VKCPNCGSISFPGVQQCKKCGHRFLPNVLDETTQARARPSGASSPKEIPLATVIASVPESGELHPTGIKPVTELLDSVPVKTRNLRPESVPNRELNRDRAPDPRPEQTWRSELTARVDDFRRRRAGARRKPDPNSVLKLDFAEVPISGPSSVSAQLTEVPKAAGTFEPIPADADISPESAPFLDSRAREAPEDWLRRIGERIDNERQPVTPGSGAPEPDVALDRLTATDIGPIEISLGIPQPDSDANAGEMVSQTLVLAPLSRRCVAGLVDALILLLGYGMFAAVFWRIGGHLSRRPGLLALIGSILVLLLIAYFAVNVAWAASTPGLLAKDLEVRRMDGGFPTVGDALLRAFGILVSLGALGLGFAWCLVDSDALTWHDRMSSTVIAAREVEQSEVES
jgi:uncharacterized RDD family membrane protein YckC